MKLLFKSISFLLASLFGIFTLGIVAVGGLYLYLAPQLPSTASLRDIRLQVPLHVYTRSGELIAEFGEMRRIPVKFADVPKPLVQAVLAAEDDRFYTHPGVDYHGLLRAAALLLKTGEKRQGGSTITMQVARNFFLGSEKTYLRKLKEILLALKIESELSKDAILELYLNKIYLGNRSYGVAAAAQFYYGANLDQLNVAQLAMLAGLPKAPSKYNPLVNLARSLERRDYILERMRSLGYLDDAAYKTALATPETARRHAPAIQVEAPYAAEMARAEMLQRYGTEAYTGGYRVFTTLDSQAQRVANSALRSALLEYDMRHGYRKALRHVELPAGASPAQWTQLLSAYTPLGGLQPALVVKLQAQGASVYVPGAGLVEIPWAGLAWARPYINESKRGPVPKSAADVLAVGDIVRVLPLPDKQWQLAQVPAVQGAFVALAPQNGAITALVGGFSFYQSSFNRVTQADRQPGSSFKPFLYSAALEKGFTPATVINDAPIVVENANLGDAWRPENYGGKFNGPTRLRDALAHSRNLVSIRVLRAIGINYAIDYATRFGFKLERLPRGLSLALGSSIVTPMELAQAYTVFANGGYRVEPYLIERIEGPDGQVLMQAEPVTVCAACAEHIAELSPEDQLKADLAREAQSSEQATEQPVTHALPPGATPAAAGAALKPDKMAKRVISPENAYLMTSMMQDVIRIGTARRALQLGRKDLAGKTGTTNEQRDAWFSGFNSDIVATAWVGFDKHLPLGDQETGGKAALPIWIRFMEYALKDLPERPAAPPPGVIEARIDPATGLLAGDNDPQAVTEYFSSAQLPSTFDEGATAGVEATHSGAAGAAEQLF
ncbi:MAG TPA: penicillin-binding protein 1A [Gammaproteobacteria bacterium]|nr:penicillin-binding protein 1A [Gammaproteobacteria bacterium]